MKKLLSSLLSLALLWALLPGAALADPVDFDPVPIPYGGNVYEVTIAEYTLTNGTARVLVHPQEGYYLTRFEHEGTEVGFEPLEGVELPINDTSPFFSVVMVALEVGGAELRTFSGSITSLAGVAFSFQVGPEEVPTAIVLYPKDTEPEDGQRLPLPEPEATPVPEEPVTPDATEAPAAETPAPVQPAAEGDGHPPITMVEPGTARFTIQGTTYDVYMLQDEPIYQRENKMDGREGHAILFSYEASDAFEDVNGTLFSEARLITPSGEEVRTYSNSGNAENPYTLYFGLPKNVYLADCLLRVPDDGGERLLPLGGGAAIPVAAAGAAPADDASADDASADDAPEPGAEEPAPATEEPAPAPTEAPAPVIASATESDVSQVLRALSEEAGNPWQKAIYDAGAQDIRSLEEGEVRFLLRAFDPGLKELGAYPGEDPLAWRAGMLENVAAYGLEVSLVWEEGEFTEASRKALARTVRDAAESTQTAYNKAAMRQCIVDMLLPLPAEKLDSSESLLETGYSELYTAWAEAAGLTAEEVERYVPLLYAQGSQKLNVKEGPHALSLECKGADPAELLSEASAATLEELAQLYLSNEMDADEIRAALYESLLQQSGKARKKAAYSFSLPLDIDALREGEFGGEYRAYLVAFDMDSAASELTSLVWALPDAPPQDYPKTGRIAGSTSGTKVTIESPDDDVLARYVMMRRSDTDEEVVSMFLRPGGSATVRVPSGFYYLLIASGEQWYGLEGLFGSEGGYSRTSETEIMGQQYYHTITLQAVEKGNMETYGASRDDFFK